MRQITITIVAVILIAGLLACTPAPSTAPSPQPAAKPDSTPTAATTPKTTSAPTASPTAKPSPAADGPVRGGILRIATNDNPPSYDPCADTTVRIMVHAGAVFSGLVRTDPMKSEVSVENIIPDLAEKWDISSDGKIYTFYLRQGVKFHDGKPFTAKDAKYSLDKFRDPKRSTLASNVAAIGGVDIVNDYTVKITLNYPSSEFLLFLLPPFCAMQPEHLKDVSPKSPEFNIGTGPFKYKSSTPGKVFTYERNPDYYIKGLPYLDGYEIYILATASLMTDQFLGGRIDTSGTPRQYLEGRENILRVRQMAPEAIQTVSPGGSSRGLIFNLNKKGPWQDVRVRKAMAMAFDFDGTIKAAVGGPEAGFISPAALVPYYIKEAIQQKEVMSILGLDKTLEERVAAAKLLMKEAGYADGFTLGCVAPNTEQHYNAVLYAADLWKRYLNIDMKVETLQTSQLYAKRDAGQFDTFYASLPVSVGASVIESLGFFTSKAVTNSGKWSNTEYDKLVDQIVREMDPGKRKDLVQKAEKIIIEDLPYLTFHHSTQGTAVRPDLRTGWPPVKGVITQPTNTTLLSMDRMWFAGTPDAERWKKTQK